MEYIDKEVYFDIYCPTCKYYEKNENDEPCRDCMNEFVNTNSHKPKFWEDK